VVQSRKLTAPIDKSSHGQQLAATQEKTGIACASPILGTPQKRAHPGKIKNTALSE
jgi:hypothetical protein